MQKPLSVSNGVLLQTVCLNAFLCSLLMVGCVSTKTAGYISDSSGHVGHEVVARVSSRGSTVIVFFGTSSSDEDHTDWGRLRVIDDSTIVFSSFEGRRITIPISQIKSLLVVEREGIHPAVVLAGSVVLLLLFAFIIHGGPNLE